jgi:hypothetical protein
MKKYASIGSISSGTMREEDLIPSFLWELKQLVSKTKYAKVISGWKRSVINPLDNDEELTPEWYENASYFLNDVLFDALQECAPPFVYFSSHPGDGADYGFWPDMDSLNESENVLKVEAGTTWPKEVKSYDYVAEVSDHGNVTLYDRRTKKELWSCV